MLSLNNFESKIDTKIVERGFSYYENGHVEILDEDTPGSWQAVVSGSENYEIEVSLAGNNINQVSCDCPYEGGLVCKHIVAVLYALKKHFKAHKTKSAKPNKMSFEDLLDKISLEELRNFVRYQKTQDRDFSHRFQLFFAEKDPTIDVKTKYEGIIRQLIRSNSSRGFMEYRQTFAFVKEIQTIMNLGYTALEQKNYKDTFNLGKVLCQEVFEIIKNCDDSAGNIGSIMSESILLLDNIAAAPTVSPDLLLQVFAFVEHLLNKNEMFDYGNFSYELLEVAEKTAARYEPDKFLVLLDTLQKKHKQDKYSFKHDYLVKTKIRFLRTINRIKEAENIENANMEIEEVRRGVVERAIKNKDFIKAKQLVGAGIQIAQDKQYPGVINTWEKVLLNIAVLEKDIDTIRYFNKKFAFHRGFHLDSYLAWKNTYTLQKWSEVIEEYIQSVIEAETNLKPRSDWDRLDNALFHRLSPIFVHEAQWERLLQVIPKDPSENMLAFVHPYLSKRFPKEILTHQIEMLLKISKRASDRPGYAHLASLMTQIKKDIEGSQEVIDALAKSFMQQYPRRPAMQEELVKVLKG